MTLPQGIAVPVSFTYEVTGGLHVAFLRLIDTTADAVMGEIPLNVRSSVDVPIAPGIDHYDATIPPLRSDYEWVRLDSTVQAARFHMRVPNAGLGRYSGRSMPGFLYSADGPPKLTALLKETKLPGGTPVDAPHHVGPMEQFDSLIPAGMITPYAASLPNVYAIGWSNGGGIEYATPYDPPVPDVPIHGAVVISKYAVELNRSGNGVQVTNKLADITGRVEFYDAKLDSAQLVGESSHSEATLNRTLPAHLAQWRVHIYSPALRSESADAYAFHCAEKSGCQLMSHQPFGKTGVTLAIDDPEEGDWRIVVRTENETQSLAYEEKEAQLSENTTGSEKTDATHGHSTHWYVGFGQGASPLYAAFRVAGTPGVDTEKDGIRIAMTPLVAGAP